ncbi:MAG: hypothetical protein WEB30_12040, partial [Cyclobacteriaceae bacterium]
MRTLLLVLSLLGPFLMRSPLWAQEKQDTAQVQADTTKAEQIIQDITDSKISKRIMKSITRKKASDPVAAVKSEEAFMPYRGKIIRNILIRHIDFQKTVYDTTRNIKNTITRIGNKLHRTSKDLLIKDNLFIRENKPV